ncbi:MAG: radical SAM protein [Caldilineales bacterium]|nr:radical SAM protein [Caldilineales bacterium]MDW8319506.1 radical SAM protein [Anaerolineae bacterium]
MIRLPSRPTGPASKAGSVFYTPSYVALWRSGELQARAEAAQQRLTVCDICPRRCEVDRLHGELGSCHTGALARVSSYGPHLGEEDVLRGWRGSGTIFFTRCNLRCQYCQNYDISQTDAGVEVTSEDLAAIMLHLQAQGCHNINFVSPTHVVPQILAALPIAVAAGLRLPLVYNTGGYDSLETLALLDGVIDIYMPDMKYADAEVAERLSKVPNYPQVNQAAVKEMHRQVGDLQINEQGLAVRGLLVRHLVLPNGLAGTEQIVRFLAREVSPHTYINIMAQYHPAYRADRYPEINRPITAAEYQAAVRAALDAGLYRLDERRLRLWYD